MTASTAKRNTPERSAERSRKARDAANLRASCAIKPASAKPNKEEEIVSADRYDFDVETEGPDALIRWAEAARDSLNSHSSTERAYGRELLNRSKQLIEDILQVPKVESPVEGFYIEPRRYD